jgi:nicotinamidase-related amidase
MRSPVENNMDLDGNAPDTSGAALLLIDVINDLDFEGNAGLLKSAAGLGKRIAQLKQRCRKIGIPAIYVNDNHGRWRSDVSTLLGHCLRPSSPGKVLVEQLIPNEEDYIVLKPKHSSFYATPLDTLLSYLGSHSVILTGLTTNACILATAVEVYVRDLKLFVPADCVAALNRRAQSNTLELMSGSFGAATTNSSRLRLRKMLDGKGRS